MEDRIQNKIRCLVRLAERPGTPCEGEAARLAAIRLSMKYGIACKFTAVGSKPSVRPTANTPPPNPVHEKPTEDAIFYRWIKALAGYGWIIYGFTDTKIGRQLQFRKLGYNSEIRVTQRKGGEDFEAEHIMRPDPDEKGLDWSYMSYMTVSLNELLRHIDYTKSRGY